MLLKQPPLKKLTEHKDATESSWKSYIELTRQEIYKA